MTETNNNFKVLIAGGGVAALEAAFALREIADQQVSITLLAPEPDFVYRPMRVVEPFGYMGARTYSLERIARDLDVALVPDAFKWLEPQGRVVHTAEGQSLPYDALLLALGARARPRYKHATTIDDRRLDEQLHGLIQDLEAGYVRSVAFVAPSPMAWPLPIYELALMTARRAYEMNVDATVTVVSSEDAPLALFGSTVSDAVQRLLADERIELITSAYAEVPEAGRVRIGAGGASLAVDRVVALPQLFGPSTPGVPKGATDGFIPVDTHCRVRNLDYVFAAGDATDFPVKHGGVAAQQADAAAEAIAALAGVAITPRPFQPEIHAVLVGGRKPLYLSAHITGGHGSSSEVGEFATWSPPTKIAARYLAPYLDAVDRHATVSR